MYPTLSRRTLGIAYRPWEQSLLHSLKKRDIDVPDVKDLHQYYHDDFSVDEAVLKIQIRQVKDVWMELHYNIGYLEELFRFYTEDHAKDFFKKFPELRDALKAPIKPGMKNRGC
jgi:HEPN domain-containing protein